LFFLISIAFEILVMKKQFDFSLLFSTKEYPSLGLLYWIFSVFFYGFGEEVGWRGYLLPRLKELGYSFKSSAFIMSFFWALWHLPLFFYINSNYSSMNVWMILGWFISLIFGAVLLNYIFYSTKKSLIAVALFHGAIDIVVVNQLAEKALLSVNIVNALIMVMGVLVLIFGKKEIAFKDNLLRKN
jgi:uncharacterized protein